MCSVLGFTEDFWFMHLPLILMGAEGLCFAVTSGTGPGTVLSVDSVSSRHCAVSVNVSEGLSPFILFSRGSTFVC